MDAINQDIKSTPKINLDLKTYNKIKKEIN